MAERWKVMSVTFGSGIMFTLRVMTPVASTNRWEVTTKYVTAHSQTFTTRLRKRTPHRIQIIRTTVPLPCAMELLSHPAATSPMRTQRSEEHTSELQSQSNLVCRLLLEKKKKKKI